MKPPIILVGYPGSQKIVRASKYLTRKYLPDFNVTYLNYTGEINGWSKYISGYLRYITDEYVIFSLDDYLISDTINMVQFHEAQSKLKELIGCVKLCESSQQENEEYPITTQYCIWHKEWLITVLNSPHINTPWEFEIMGSKFFNGHSAFHPCLKYFTNSSISGRWEGVRLDGLSNEDKKYIIDNGLIS